MKEEIAFPRGIFWWNYEIEDPKMLERSEKWERIRNQRAENKIFINQKKKKKKKEGRES